MELLFSYHPGQAGFALPYVSEFLSVAQDIVTWGSGSPFFSLEGYAGAVYGSFERFLAEVSRLYFGGTWRFEGGSGPADPRVLCAGLTQATLMPGHGVGSGALASPAGGNATPASGGPAAAGASPPAVAGTPIALPATPAGVGTPLPTAVPAMSVTPIALPLRNAGSGEAALRPSSAHSGLGPRRSSRPGSAHSVAVAGNGP
ncbi:hypothetical protein GPECTOR_39g501 [Gonium pectorale]|uniref:Uncharacterized protein n=1 Tax=Gonium pectorale TaxID=33097 RepID=A0A150GAY4_GONPE|nr:hypothetical protein GPECTOR_39g501 [Gonium pectorale]|eukprot:KXZ47007.1 hypothetical protein GPECTOR_39g501 [Gonium pectorale]